MKLKLLLVYFVPLLLFSSTSILILRYFDHTLHLQPATVIDNFVSQPRVTEYDQAGKIKMQIHAVLATHEKNNDSTFFTQPRLLFHENKNTLWQIQAEKAVFRNSKNKMILSGNVVIHQTKSNHIATTIKTTTLTLYPKKLLAETNDLVSIEQPNLVVHGNGFIANLKTGVYKLTSQSNAIVQPSLFHHTQK